MATLKTDKENVVKGKRKVDEDLENIRDKLEDLQNDKTNLKKQLAAKKQLKPKKQMTC